VLATFAKTKPMSRRILIPLFFLLTSVIHGYSQDIQAVGKITDSRTGKGVKASIRYSSIPTGSIFGRFMDSTFTFSIFGTAKYQITASADGYNPRTVIVDPKDIDTNKKVVRDITLIPKGETMVLDHLIFAQGKSVIDPKSYAQLDEVVQMMKENSKIEIQLEGHTDNQGNPKINLQLSQNRVEAVKKYLVDKGIAKNRIQTKAFGGTQPLRNEMTQEARALNRRVEMRVLKD
jgi:OmpA-OmpF porin, OOP family